VALRIFGLLPLEQAQEVRSFWEEFEAAESAEARFTKSLDRLQPLVHNLPGRGTWIPPKVTEVQLEQRCGAPIRRGAPHFWEHAQTMVQKHFSVTNNDERT
jgi:putative hydrolase of HD superfamily